MCKTCREMIILSSFTLTRSALCLFIFFRWIQCKAKHTFLGFSNVVVPKKLVVLHNLIVSESYNSQKYIYMLLCDLFLHHIKILMYTHVITSWFRYWFYILICFESYLQRQIFSTCVFVHVYFRVEINVHYVLI